MVGGPCIASTEYEGEPKESDEMRPAWFNIADIPYQTMWPDDILWLPLLLKGAKFSGYFKFEGHDNILEYTLNEVDTLNYSDYEDRKQA